MDATAMRVALSDPAVFPHAAMAWARANAVQSAPVLLSMLTACTTGGDITDVQAEGAFLALPLLASQREPRALPVLCALARNGDRLWEIFGDFGAAHLHRLIVGVCGDNTAAVFAIAQEPSIDPFVRTSFLLAGRWLMTQQDVAPDAAFDALLALRTTLQTDDGPLWDEWARALIGTDAKRAMPIIRGSCDDAADAKALPDIADYADLAEAWAEDPLGQRDTFLAENGPIDDAIGFMERWLESAERAEEGSSETGDDADAHDATADTPVHNPYRDVSRNDPCPCGSGKKFKKCCLLKVEDERAL